MSLKCPKCGSEEGIEVTEKSFFCKNYTGPDGDPDGCNFILWRGDLEKYFKGPQLSESQATKLIKGEYIELKGLVGKAGKKFDCKGQLSEIDTQKGKRWGVQFVFEETERRVLGE
jgi:hypothetical protein